ncbi:MAG: hypothetical protein IJ736_01945, partial [Firmicutes bacterium]|nr:hypothetical protein [Bacillota bacterium]
LGIEIFVPGFGLFGISGILSLILSWILSFIFLDYPLAWILVEILVAGLLFIILLRAAKAKKIKDKIILGSVVGDDEDIKNTDTEYIGQSGIVKTPLRPFGTVSLENGQIIEVCSQDGYIGEGEKVEIIYLKENKFFVKKSN